MLEAASFFYIITSSNLDRRSINFKTILKFQLHQYYKNFIVINALFLPLINHFSL